MWSAFPATGTGERRPGHLQSHRLAPLCMPSWVCARPPLLGGAAGCSSTGLPGAPEVGTQLSPHVSVLAAIAKNQDPLAQNDSSVFSLGSGGQKPRTKGLAGWAPSRGAEDRSAPRLSLQPLAVCWQSPGLFFTGRGTSPAWASTSTCVLSVGVSVSVSRVPLFIRTQSCEDRTLFQVPGIRTGTNLSWGHRSPHTPLATGAGACQFPPHPCQDLLGLDFLVEAKRAASDYQ